MKECWINVYQFKNSSQWLGNKLETKEEAVIAGIMSKCCVYRLHVKLKERKPKIEFRVHILDGEKRHKPWWI
jgi:hypothetical protein